MELTKKIVWLWRMKLIHAMASHPMPRLTGVIQVDETFIRESQKGSRTLISNVKGEERTARYGRNPSKLGVLGPEFATVTTAIDNVSHCVCKVSGLGKLTPEQFIEHFEEYLISPSYLCSNANNTYLHYSQLFNIPHYIKPSNYLSVLERNGYIIGNYPSSIKDAEQIFLDILKLRKNYTIHDVKNQSVELQKPSGRYVSQLKKETKKARSATSNRYFKFDEEDRFKNFDKRAYLSDLPKTRLYAICKECGLKKYKSLSLWSVISQLMKQPDIDMIIYRLWGEGRYYDISEEDLEEIKAGHFKIKVKTGTPTD